MTISQLTETRSPNLVFKCCASMHLAIIIFAGLIAASSSMSQVYGKSIRFAYNDAGDVISAEYWGSPGDLESLNLTSYPKLVSLDIVYYTTLNQNDLNEIAKISTLEELILGQDAILGETVVLKGAPAVLRSLKRLRCLKLAVAGFEQSNWVFLSELPELESLEVDVGEYFDAKPCTLTNVFGKTICKIPSLLDLDILGAKSLTDSFFENAAGKKNRLERLHLTSGKFSDDALLRLSTGFPNLRYIEIGGEQVTDNGIRHVTRLSQLQELRIYSPKLTSKSLRSASTIPTITDLELTVLSANADDLKALSQLPNLERLILRRFKFDDESLSFFVGHPTLVSLFCDGSQLDQAKTIQFVRSLPNVDYISLGRASSPLQQAVSLELKRIEQLRNESPR